MPGGCSRQRWLIENENTIAQVEWASRRLPGLNLGDDQVEMSAEARARRLAELDAIGMTLSATWDWLYDQPFSSDPAIFGSYHASMRRCFEDGVRFAERGRRANPKDWLILNNLAFCLASLGRWKDADVVLRDVPTSPSPEVTPTITATRGLIRLRAGDIATGQRLYRDAIDAMASPAHKLRAEMMMLSEEQIAGITPSQKRLAEVADSVNRVYPQLKVWMGYLADL